MHYSSGSAATGVSIAIGAKNGWPIRVRVFFEYSGGFDTLRSTLYESQHTCMDFVTISEAR